MSRPTNVATRSIQSILSNGSSRSVSRAATPKPDGDENGALDVNFNALEELLAQKLQNLQDLLNGDDNDKSAMHADPNDSKQKQISAMNKSRIQTETSINEIVSLLGHPRTEVLSKSRELLLAQLYKLIVTKPLAFHNDQNAGTDRYVGDSTVSALVKILEARDYRSPSEFSLLLRSVISLIASNLDDFSEHVGDVLPVLEALMVEAHSGNVTSENKASVVTGYCALYALLHADTSAFGADDKVKWLLDLAQGFVQNALVLEQQLKSGDREYLTLMDERDDKRLVSEQEAAAAAEGSLAVASLHGVAVLLTLFKRGEYLNELLSDVATAAVEFLEMECGLEVHRACGRVLALCYELYTYDDTDDVSDYNYNAPYYEQEQLLASLGHLSAISAKRIGKTLKRETTTLFSQVATTIENYTAPELREEMYKRSAAGLELMLLAVSTSHLKLLRLRLLPINSWFLYFRLLHLKWSFGFGLHDQLVSSEPVRLFLREPPTQYQEKYNLGEEYSEGTFGNNARSDVERFANLDKKRDNDIRKARVQKLTTELDGLEL